LQRAGDRPFQAKEKNMLRPAPKGFASLSTIPGARLEILYGTTRNFTGAILPGYGSQGAWLLGEGHRRLAECAAELRDRGLGFWIWDAYRPRRATLEMVAWAERTGQAWIVEQGYIARRSRHNSGAAVDLSLYRLNTGQLLDMGTEWDTFEDASHIANAEGAALENRMLLQEAMGAHGWKGYEKEWWHFELPGARGFSLRDVPYCTEEPPEDPSVC
jgi:zinc D-Ala-D-Ala dipeptidase